MPLFKDNAGQETSRPAPVVELHADAGSLTPPTLHPAVPTPLTASERKNRKLNVIIFLVVMAFMAGSVALHGPKAPPPGTTGAGMMPTKH
jgi:hypothetical protein